MEWDEKKILTYSETLLANPRVTTKSEARWMLFWHVVRTLQVLVVLMVLVFYLFSRAKSGDMNQQHRVVTQSVVTGRNGATPFTVIGNNSRLSGIFDVDSRRAVVFMADSDRSSGIHIGDSGRGREHGAARDREHGAARDREHGAARDREHGTARKIESSVPEYIMNKYPVFNESRNASVVLSPVYRKLSFNSQASKYKLFNSEVVSDDSDKHIYFNNYSNLIEKSEPLYRGKIKRIPKVHTDVRFFVNPRRDISGKVFSALTPGVAVPEGQPGTAGVSVPKEEQSGAAGVAAPKEEQSGAGGVAVPKEKQSGAAGVAAPKEEQSGAAGVATSKEEQSGAAGVAAPKEEQSGAAGVAAPKEEQSGAAGVAAPKDEQSGAAGVATPTDSGPPFRSSASTKPSQRRVNLTTAAVPIRQSSYRELCVLDRPALHRLTGLQLLLTPPPGSSGQESLLRRLLCPGSVGYGAAVNPVHGRNKLPEKVYSEKTKVSDVLEDATGTVTMGPGNGRPLRS